MGGRGQALQRPFGLLGLAARLQLPAVGGGHEFARRWRAGQGDEGAALRLAQARLAPAPRPHPQPIEAPRVERLEPLARGLGVTVERRGNPARALTLPTAHDHLGMGDPVGGSMRTGRQFLDLTRFARVQGWARLQPLGPRTPPCPLLPA
ncbi:MAG TPA: hypothetical protein VF916_16295, partial [Ktedonobacterales bacterium]